MTEPGALNRPRPICDYEGSNYRTDFWIGQGREYEDLSERIALRRLLPPRGRRVLEIGAGFGRLASLYAGYEEVILLDFSSSMLGQAREVWGADPRFTFVAADLYDLPFFDQQFDAVVMVRVLHHLVDVPKALAELRRVMRDDATFVLEFANKRHVKAIARYLLQRQSWNPFDQTPYEFAKLNFDFHPRWMFRQIRGAGLVPQRVLALSFFRAALLKRLVAPALLARLDRWLQPIGTWWHLTPSIMIAGHQQPANKPAPQQFWRCLQCGTGELAMRNERLQCLACGQCWQIQQGIAIMKTG